MFETMTDQRTVSLTRFPKAGLTGYLLALALLGPFFSPLIGIWGEASRPGSVVWRFGVYGLIIGGQFYLLGALALAAFVAASLGRRTTLLAIGVTATILTLLLAIGLPPFVLDFLQLKRSMNPTAFAPFRTAGMKVLAMAAIGIPIMAITGFYIVRAGKALESERKPRGAPVLAGRK